MYLCQNVCYALHGLLSCRQSTPKSIEGFAKEIIAGKWVDEIAKEVIRGDWGNGDERKKRLTEAGYYYDKVQKSERVNLLVASRSMLNIGYGAIFKY